MYQYIGPKEILQQVKPEKVGTIIKSKFDIKNWINTANQELDSNDEITATFVIDLSGNLRVNDRRSEHVVCANGKNILSAGEITFEIYKQKVLISQITNQSTGYCPSPKSWKDVMSVLDKLETEYPEYWTTEFIFRVCEKCNNINIVKENYFVCLICDNDLPEHE